MKTLFARLNIYSTCLFLALPVGGMSARERKRGPEGVESRGDTSTSLRTSEGNPKRLSTQETKERAITQVAAQYPSSCRCEGAVTVEIHVNAEGKVERVRALSGHPLLRANAVRAAKRWTFKPLVRGDKAVAFVGMLTFSYKL
jgi:TonB family protein